MIKLSQLFHGYIHANSINDCVVDSLTLDARQVKAGGLFLAVQGSQVHGLKYLKQALENGVGVVAYELNEYASQWLESIDVDVPLIPIKNLSRKVSEIAARFYGNPSRDLTVIAITGTNGKTTCAYLLAQLLEKQGFTTALIGTLGSGYWNELSHSGLTTPDAVSLQKHLAEFKQVGITHVVMEASSHALAQYRLDAVAVDIAAFTNLSQDHLDYHISMDEYLQAKLRLFQFESLRAAVMNADDLATKEVLKVLNVCVESSVYKASTQANDLCDLFEGYCLFASQQATSALGTSFMVNNKNVSYPLRSALLGEFNVSNLLLCTQVMLSLGFELEQLLTSIENLLPPPGRLQSVAVAKDTPYVVIDYAHTPDALHNVLTTLKDLQPDELVAVFGCGGDRDTSKRPQMGAIAEALADKVILTDDNPRTESSGDIIRSILAGFKASDKALVVSDRAEAIKKGIEQASINDIVLIAGKGHEDYQIIGEHKKYFSDYEQAVSALQEWRAVA